jgi:predicted site-specific integrase-resolvase
MSDRSEGRMMLEINGTQYYRTHEACLKAGITKNTFLRWVARGSYPDVNCRDRRGWRLFTEDEVKRLQAEVNKINIALVGPNKTES